MKGFYSKVLDIAPPKWSWCRPYFIFFLKKGHHSTQNEKLGKFTKFSDPNVSIECAILEKPQGGGASEDHPANNRVKEAFYP